MASPSAGRSPKADAPAIMVVDDNHALRAVVVKTLSGAGYRVVDWADPMTALDHLSSTHDDFALALIDGVMPQMLGPDMAAEIDLLRPGIPIMLMSGHEAPMFHGFFGKLNRHYISKPFALPDLIARVGAIVGASPPHRD